MDIHEQGFDVKMIVYDISLINRRDMMKYKVGFINYKKNQYETRVLECKDKQDLINQVDELEKQGIVYDNVFMPPHRIKE